MTRRDGWIPIVLAATMAAVSPAPAQVFDFTAAYFDGQVQGAETINGLSFVWGAAVSADGKHVYACGGVANIASGGADDNAIVAFSRSAATGALTYVDSYFDDQDGGTADGLFSCRDVEVSPDGKHVYTCASSEHEVGWFSRDAMTGVLTFGGTVTDGSGGVDGLAGCEDTVLSPDGKHLYAAGRADDAVAVFSRNTGTGALTFVEFEKNLLGGVTHMDRPIAIDLSPDGKHIYVASGSNANFTGSDALAVFSRETNSGSANFGKLTFLASYQEGQIQGLNTIDGVDQVSDVKVSPDGNHVYAAAEVDTLGGASGNGNDWIAIFSRDSSTGLLTWQQRIAGFKICPTSPFGADAESFLRIGSEGLRVYVLKNWADNGVAAFARNPSTGALIFLDGVCDFDPDSIGLNLPRKLALSPLGEDLYVPGNAADALAAVQVCAGGFVVLDLSNTGTVSTTESKVACDTIIAGGEPTGYFVGAAGDVTFTAPIIRLTNGFGAEGTFTVVNGMP